MHTSVAKTIPTKPPAHPGASFVPHTLRLATLTLLVACSAVREPTPIANGAHARFVGTWMLEGAEPLDSAGRMIATSHDVRGIIIYTPEGRVAVQNMLLPRPTFAVVPQGRDGVNAWNDGATYRRRFAFRDGKLLLNAEDPRERWQYVWTKVPMPNASGSEH